MKLIVLSVIFLNIKASNNNESNDYGETIISKLINIVDTQQVINVGPCLNKINQFRADSSWLDNLGQTYRDLKLTCLNDPLKEEESKTI